MEDIKKRKAINNLYYFIIIKWETFFMFPLSFPMPNHVSCSKKKKKKKLKKKQTLPWPGFNLER